MQENRLEELKVEGWKRMHAILDKEMPQKKRDRKFPFFWLLVGMLLGIGAFYVYNKFSNQNKSQNIIVNKSNVIAEQESPNKVTKSISDSIRGNDYSSSEINQSSKPLHSNSSTSSTNNLSSGTSSELALNSASTHSEKLSSKSTRKSSSSKLSKSNNVKSTSKDFNSKENLSNANGTILNTTLENPKVSNSSSFQKISGNIDNNVITSNLLISNSNLEISNSQILFDLDELNSNIQLVTINPKSDFIIPGLQLNKIKPVQLKNNKVYSIMLASNMNLNSMTKHLSYDLGLVQQFNFWKKFSITLGTEYEFAMSNDDFINCAITRYPEINKYIQNNSRESFSLPSAKNDPEYNKIFNIDKSAKLVTSVQSLNFPLRFNYHFNSKWSIGLGTEFSILLNRNAMKLDSFAYTCLINFRTTNFDYIRIRNKEFRYSAGLAYKLNSRLNINFDASYYRDRYDYTPFDIQDGNGGVWNLDIIPYKRNFFNFGLGVQYRIY